jgi:hypothetical protein
MATDAMAADHRAIGPQRGAALHHGLAEFILARHGRAGVHHVGEHRAGATEDIIFKGHALINGDVVLDANVRADADIPPYVYSLSKRRVTSNYGPRAYTDPVPYLS